LKIESPKIGDRACGVDTDGNPIQGKIIEISRSGEMYTLEVDTVSRGALTYTIGGDLYEEIWEAIDANVAALHARDRGVHAHVQRQVERLLGFKEALYRSECYMIPTTPGWYWGKRKSERETGIPVYPVRVAWDGDGKTPDDLRAFAFNADGVLLDRFSFYGPVVVPEDLHGL
jgi:hypothetical protein